MKKIKVLLARINFPSEEDIPVWSIVIPQEGAISPSHNPIWSDVMQNIAQWMKNRSMQIMQYKISCTIILNRYLSASALKVFWKLFRFRMQSTEGWQEHKCQWSFHIVRQDLSKIWPGWLKSSPFFWSPSLNMTENFAKCKLWIITRQDYTSLDWPRWSDHRPWPPSPPPCQPPWWPCRRPCTLYTTNEE